MSWPAPSTARQRSASPSCAMPRSAPCSTTAAFSRSRWVEPQSSLMFSPSGWAPMVMTSAPARATASGRAVPGGAGAVLLVHGLDPVLQLVGELVAAAREELDAVVRHGVVARG